MNINGTEVCFDAGLVGPWVAQRANMQYMADRYTAIGRFKDGKLVAGVLYEDCNGANVVCHIAAEGQWANKTYMWLIFDYPFNQLGVKRITTTVNPDNEVSQRFTEDLGFSVECKLKDAHPKGDLWVFRMFRDECKWLRLGDAIRKHRHS